MADNQTEIRQNVALIKRYTSFSILQITFGNFYYVLYKMGIETPFFSFCQVLYKSFVQAWIVILMELSNDCQGIVLSGLVKIAK